MSRKHKTMMAPVLLIIWSYLCQNHIASAICNYTQVETCLDRHFTLCLCIDCKICPPGEGLEPQCDTQVITQVPKCVKCTPGKNYSGTYSIEACNPCHMCEGTETLQRCNATHDTICSKDCARGYKMSSVTDTCEKDFTDDVWSKLNLTKRSGEINNKESKTSQERKISPTTIVPAVKYIGRGNGKGQVAVYIACALAIAVGWAIVCLLYKNWTHVKRKLRKITKTRSLDEDILLNTIIPNSLLLKDISTDLAFSIAALISNHSRFGLIKNWRNIGDKYGLKYEELNLIKQATSNNENTTPGLMLLEKIHSIKPEETVNGFIEVLKEMKRNDVIKLIRDECSQRNNGTSSQDNQWFNLHE